jgi:2-polyprenyl-3-methyl-5-hydroxy-6-metoxy-1,4-benzoquinol methylase
MDCPVCSSSSTHCKHTLYDDRYGFEGYFNLQICNRCDHAYLAGAPIDSVLGDLYTNFYPRKSFNPNNFKAYTKGGTVQNWLVGGKSSACQSVTPGTRVLDIGCGYGETLAYMESLGCDVYGIDADRNVREIAKKFGFKIHIGVFNSSIYEPDFFDFVTMNQVIEHVPNVNETFSAISKILKPGGICVISTPNANGWGAKLFGRRWINWHVPYHQQFISNKSIQILAELHGFQMQKIETIARSEWLMYQVLHLLNYPLHGKPSSFWAPYKQKRTFTKKILQKIIVSSQFLLIPQIITRIFDTLGIGDNYIIVLKKK